MGCDIHIFAEDKREDGSREGYQITYDDERYNGLKARSYSRFCFLAGVRNYSAVKPIAEPRGFPDDASPEARESFDEWGVDAHTPSYLTLDELLTFDYDQLMEDRRTTVQTGPNSWDGGATAPKGCGKKMTWRQFLGNDYVEIFPKLRDNGFDRIVFWFDS